MIYEKHKTKNISFPLGGIGTGCVGLAGNGELNDWEIFNRPNKNTRNGYSHFSIKAVRKGVKTVKVLHGDTNENYVGMHHSGSYIGFGFGPWNNSMAGFPHFKEVKFEGEYPIARLTYKDEDFPAVVRLCAFNPIIPHDDFNSSLPVAFFEWEIENTTEDDIEYAVAFNVSNPMNVSCNKKIESKCGQGIFYACADKKQDEIGYCDLSVMTDAKDVGVQTYWFRGSWMDAVTTYWKNFSDYERLQDRTYSDNGQYDGGTVASYVNIPKGCKSKIRFILAWNVPVQYNYWDPMKDDQGKDVTWKNYYATQFENSCVSAEYALSNFESLYDKTEKFIKAVTESTLPDFVIDAILSNLSVLKSPTVLRLEDGSLWGWEGCHETFGSCEGSCQHVWNYAYALPFLFPQLERSLRENTLKYAMKESGATKFRVPLPLGRDLGHFRSCVDGQMGEVIKCYREWKISGDKEWLITNADRIFKLLEFAWSEDNEDQWDSDCDGVLTGRQHHTLDVELFGANSWLQGFYLLALDCASKMAEELGDTKRKEKYRSLYQKGKDWTNKNLFNGEYFVQKVNLKDKSVLEKFGAQGYYWNDEIGEIKYQIGEGCIIDQMLAEWHAVILGSEEIFDKDKKDKALESLYKFNYKPCMREVTNMWRNFALNDEAGTVICSYPDGKSAPGIPIPYCEETMTGFEYALGGLMISQGFITEGENIVKAIRARYDGEKRNPWNEIECGSNYARSMASFGLLPIYSGFSFDMTKNHIGFNPIIKKESQYFWSVGASWGNVSFKESKSILSVIGNGLTLTSFGLRNGDKAVKVFADGKQIDFKQSGNAIVFDKTIIKNNLEIQTK